MEELYRKYPHFPPVDLPGRQWPERELTRAPRYMSVDLRDGNQALRAPLAPEEKLEFFSMLCGIGFKEIEIAYPASSHDDYAFTRELISGGHIPDDVTVGVLAPCRREMILKTLEAVRGAARVVFHIYIAVSDLHLQTVLHMTRDEARAHAEFAARLVREAAEKTPETEFTLEFSPEEFSAADLDFSAEICRAVRDIWEPAPGRELIFNLPATVERRGPNQFADMVETFCRRFPKRENITVSLHPHNDQGMAMAAAELGLLAGGERLEGTLFGQGERTGNLDLVTFAGNLLSRGIDPGLDFSRLSEIAARFQKLTGEKIAPRQPYSGRMAFTAFSGTHQDAIRKGMDARQAAGARAGEWRMPYLHVDPADFGWGYEQLVRLNSQSGKGGAAWLLERHFGIKLPPALLPELGRAVQAALDITGGELSPEALYRLFHNEFVEPPGRYALLGYWPNPDPHNPYLVHGVARLRIDGTEVETRADGNGPVSAFIQALQKVVPQNFTLSSYHEQALDSGENARALSCVELAFADGSGACGVGVNTNITQATAHAVIAAVNRAGK